MKKKINNKKENKQFKDTDESVQKMIDSWDIVKCHNCGKEISMLKAKSVNNGEYFVCKNGC